MIKSYYSGFQSVETSGAQYNGVNATFTAPVVNSGVAHCDNPGANVSSWTGLQGPGDGRLIQDGVEAGQDRSGNSEFAWFEFFGTQGHNSETKMNLSIHQGDQIESGVEWHASQNNAQFTIYDVTTGQVDSAVLNNDYDFYNGAQGQFITERNMVNGTIEPLMYFNEQAWSQARLSVGPNYSYQDFGTRSPTAIEMHQGGNAQGNLLAMPPQDQLDSNSNNSSKVDQVSCGNPGY